MSAQILIISNPFQPLQGMEKHIAYDGGTVREWLRDHFGPEFVEFDKPTVLQWNGKLIMRAEWATREIKNGDILCFVYVPQGWEILIYAVVAIVVGIAVALLMPDPKIPGDNTHAADSVYTLRGQTNRFRPNEPIEVLYGKPRTWPTYACRPYSEYIGNQQYQYSLFCLGQGEYDIAAIQLDDTPVTDFTDVEIEIVPPGSTVNLVESAVYTALEVSNIELLGPNQDDYTGISGPYTINDWETPIHRIGFDISFPQGLYHMSDEGGIQSFSVQLLFEYRSIDENGDPLGAWITAVNPTISRRENTPQRLTYSLDVTEGRYEVRGQRITNRPNGPSTSSQVIWETVKGYAKNIGTFGNITMIAMKALATNSLNDTSAKSFNVIATRKLPTWTPEDGWGPLTATRNPIWSFCDVFRSVYGAKLGDQFLDMPNLYALSETFEEREEWFDWVFDGPLSIWEAAKMVLRVGRTVPIPQGSLVTAVRDDPQTLPSAIFNQHNIVRGSLNKKLSMFDFQPFDGVIVEYMDPNTWKTKEVTCVLPGRDGLNLDRVKLPGCTDRNRAYREGLYIQSRREIQRKTVTFQTGLEGHIPTYMDLVSITHDTLRVGQGGMIVAYDSETKEMTLSEQVVFGGPELTHKLAIRGDDGAVSGSIITVTPGSASNKVILAEDPEEELDFSENRVPPLYAFGVADFWSFLGKVSSVKPVDENNVEITCVNYDDRVYAWQDAIAGTVTPRPVIRNPSNPRIDWVTIAPAINRDDRAYISWLPAPGAAAYILQTSYDDGDTWNLAGNYPAPPVEIGTNPGTLMVRVAAYSLAGNVIWTNSLPYVVGSNIAPPLPPEAVSPQPPFVDMVAVVKWYSNGANGYNVDIYDGATLLRTIAAGTALKVEYDNADWLADGGTSRTLEFRIRGFNGGGQGEPVSVTLTNPVPAVPTALAVGSPTGSNYPATWDHVDEGDEKEYRVYASTSPGFTPGPSNLVATRTTKDATLAAPVRPLYWRVGAVDVWGPEISLSAEATIP